MCSTNLVSKKSTRAARMFIFGRLPVLGVWRVNVAMRLAPQLVGGIAPVRFPDLGTTRLIAGPAKSVEEVGRVLVLPLEASHVWEGPVSACDPDLPAVDPAETLLQRATQEHHICSWLWVAIRRFATPVFRQTKTYSMCHMHADP